MTQPAICLANVDPDSAAALDRSVSNISGGEFHDLDLLSRVTRIETVRAGSGAILRYVLPSHECGSHFVSMESMRELQLGPFMQYHTGDILFHGYSP